VTVFAAGMYLVLIPYATRRRDDHKLLSRRIALSSILLASAAALWTALGYVIPTSIGHAFLGNSWSSAKPLLLPTGIAIGLVGAAFAPLSGLRALGASRFSFRARMWSLPLMLIFSLSFAAWRGALGFAAGSIVEAVITSYLLARAFHRANATQGAERDQLHRRRARHAAPRSSLLTRGRHTASHSLERNGAPSSPPTTGPPS
jgi:O-antigen/teichoic acid export membrane protein